MGAIPKSDERPNAVLPQIHAPQSSTRTSRVRVLFATAEFAPLVKVGGLGDFSAGYAKAVGTLGAHIEVALPDCETFDLDHESSHQLDVPDWCAPASLRTGTSEGLPLALFSVPGIARPNPYVDSDGADWDDKDHRFLGFSATVAAWASGLQRRWAHLND